MTLDHKIINYTHWVTKAGQSFLDSYRHLVKMVKDTFNKQRDKVFHLNHKHMGKYQSKLDELKLPNELIEASAIYYQTQNIKLEESEAQGLWLDKDFICGETGKKITGSKRKGLKIFKAGAQLYTDHLMNKNGKGKEKDLRGKNKYIVFKGDEKKVSVIVIKNGLSTEGKKALEYFYQMHSIVDPTLMKLCCKISGWPVGELIKQGFNRDGSREAYGKKNMTPHGYTQTGRSAKNYYETEDGEYREFMVENPCSRMSYYKMKEIEDMWNDEKFGIADKLDKPWAEVKHLFDAYFEDMKKAYLEHMEYFFEPDEREKYGAGNLNKVYFGEMFHFSSNMFDQNKSCACHHDTKPVQKGFPSGITAMGVDKDGNERHLYHGEGELCFVELACNVQYNKGDIVLMDPELYHGILPLKGPRFSLVLYNNRGKLTVADEIGSDDEV